MPSASNIHKAYWGFWASIGFGILIFLVFSLIQFIFFLGYALYQQGSWNSINEAVISLEHLALNGDAIAIAEIPAAFIGTLLVLVFASIPKAITTKDYLQSYLPSISNTLKWLGIMVLVIIALELMNILLQRQTPEFMTKVYFSSSNHFILWIAIGLGAPFFEEFLFRGFLFEGLRHSAVGVTGAILITSASWAIIHVQYGWYEIISIFFIGIVFSIAKIKTKSIYIPVLMHLLMNSTASIMMELSQKV